MKFRLFAIIICCVSIGTSQSIDGSTLPYIDDVYPRIKIISDGPHIYHPSFINRPYLPNPDGEYSFLYRIVVARAELWDQLYLEKVSKYDEEGRIRKVSSGMLLPLDEIYPHSDFKEQRQISSVTWIDSNTVELEINWKKYQLKPSEYISYKLHYAD